MFARIVNRHLHALAIVSAVGITATLVLGAATLFASAAQASPTQSSTRTVASSSSRVATSASVERGRYLAAIASCNDCHTAGYAETGGKTPVTEWLAGVPVGFKGPWGLSYPSNLRLTVQGMTEAQWLIYSRAERLPPMPWFAMRDMSDDDVRSLYRFLRSLGPKGDRMPTPVAPGAPISTPFILFQPQMESSAALR